MPIRRIQRSPLPLLLTLLCACSLESEPSVEVWANNAFVPAVVGSYEIDGQRDGATTRATAILLTDAGTRIQLTLEIRYDPTPALTGGAWSVDGEENGEVRAESLEFVGGQGEGPSLGGVFVLEQSGEARYRVQLPLRPIGRDEWDVN